MLSTSIFLLRTKRRGIHILQLFNASLNSATDCSGTICNGTCDTGNRCVDGARSSLTTNSPEGFTRHGTRCCTKRIFDNIANLCPAGNADGSSKPCDGSIGHIDIPSVHDVATNVSRDSCCGAYGAKRRRIGCQRRICGNGRTCGTSSSARAEHITDVHSTCSKILSASVYYRTSYGT
jgi:hypothetical protein